MATPTAHLVNKLLVLPPAICISLKGSVDRRAKVMHECAEQGLDVEFLLVDPAPDPVRGCLESHVAAVALANERCYPAVLIFEDDVEFIKDTYDAALIAAPARWDMLFLGYNAKQGPPTAADRAEEADDAAGSTNAWLRLRSAWSAHAYIVHSAVFDDIMQGALDTAAWGALREEHETLGIDVFYRHVLMPHKHVWGAYPMLALQAPGYSALEQRVVDYRALLLRNADVAAGLPELIPS